MTLNSPKKNIIVVLGMHRSGTSALTRGLQALDIQLGDDLIAGLPGNNERGFWEDADINSLNNEILHSLGSSWSSCGVFLNDHSTAQALDTFKLSAVNLIRKKTENCNYFGIKDPRICRLLPFWQDIFAHEKIDVHYVIAVRNPLSVADSLKKRDQFDSKKSYLLWIDHQLSAVRGTQGCSRVVVEYDALLESPELQMKRLSEMLGLTPPNAEAIRNYEDTFLEKSLRHSSYQLRDLTFAKDLPPAAVNLYRTLLRAAQTDSLDSMEILLQEAANLDWGSKDYPIILKYIDECEEKIHQTNVACLAQKKSIAEQVEKVASLKNANTALQEKAESLKDENTTLLGTQATLHGTINSLRSQAEDLRCQNVQLSAELSRLIESNSWRMTAPLRALRRLIFTHKSSKLKDFLFKFLRRMWHALPVSEPRKQNLKQSIYSLYQRASSSFGTHTNHPHEDNSSGISFLAKNSDVSLFVPRIAATHPLKPPVRLIAFYLPQFHAITENNEWWGEGFTEWTNVRPATPLYQGHYQPHVPHPEIGYYNLLDTEVQRKQISLAKEYGIGGFCFYFYWFAGHRLLESPTLNYLENKELDHPFCLCWANENWSRRWDGLDSEILIGQNHTPEDDIAFISYVSKYLEDERYIRIEGKPLLLVYRPSLLPNAAETARRWRQWCRENGIGEIYLAYTQSFETTPPSKYGFDAAIEFPPNNSAPPDVTSEVLPMASNFAGKVYDWSIFIERSKQYKRPDYKLFRSVCPSWDNTARRKNRSISFTNSSPWGYQEWLCNAVEETLAQAEKTDKDLVFVNAWNEWAEGAHLEPDMRYGFAYLEATRMALIRSSVRAMTNPVTEKTPLAVIIHSFYPDVLDEILSLLTKSVERQLFLYVTTTCDKVDQVKEKLGNYNFNYKIIETANRGRDVLPFLIAGKQAIADGFELILKVHTKKSLHREDGESWRKELYQGLLAPEAINQSIDLFAADPSIGIIAPSNHIVEMNYYWGANAERVMEISLRLGIQSPEQLCFAAGTMFFIRSKALLPILELGFTDGDFETEQGQVDGTLAHALERAFAISTASVKMKIAALGATKNTVEYAYAKRSQHRKN